MRNQNRSGVLWVMVLGTMMAGLDSSIVNISLPVMSRQFDCSLDDIEWVITVYMLSFSLLMPMTNWLKSKLGFFNLYIAAIGLFTLGSVLCALSGSLETLLIARVIQALGGGAIAPVSMAIVSYVFPARVRGSVLGWWGLGNLMGPAMGPTLGGFLTEHFGWPSIFFINLPIGIIAIALSFRYLGFLRQQVMVKIPFDLSGFVAFTIFLITLQYGIAKAERIGWTGPQILISLAVAIVALVCFIFIERKKEFPLIDLQLFRNYAFVSCILVTISRSAALFGGLFLLPFLLQGLLGYSESASGLLILPNALLMAALMPFAGKWSDKHGSRKISMVGLALLALSMWMFSLLDQGSPIALILTAMSIRGIGMGLLVAPLSAATISAVRPAEVTMASAVSSLLQQVGGALGIAVLAIISQSAIRTHMAAGMSEPLAQHLALQTGFRVSMGILLVTLIPAWFLPRKNTAVPDDDQRIHT
ncbi:DHA2 family efflux MFS transporter permease subunit [Chitinophaga pendula]|uniref:DHA2 family efflux MFS transporter permease subunit n=1 Tax=Chitinophaga TaxID=79328 RepID=UPI000BAF49F8|nr:MULTISPECIES: DHA2 family efflux MFS transporter permease subunit [Chitinophaga]ASZ09722.1 MFS transporter [Chitinophaga sp. MD30]UCJ07334.1 DHA2 family efflux MFS transporter permease subunit [Chitinophaga pendula]